MDKLPIINARDLLALSKDEMFDYPHELFELQFVDGSLITTKQRTAWSWLLWDVHREYPDTPLSVHHHIGNVPLKPMTHAEVLSRIKTDCKNLYSDPAAAYSNMMALNRVVYGSFNNMYNVLTTELQEYILTASALDILEVLNHPQVKLINESIERADNPSAPVIESAHEQIERILMTDVSLTRNALAIAARNGLVKSRQLIQCVSARGYISEVNDQNFKTPMLTNYSTGMTTLAAYAMDSRTASISAFAQESTMRAFQYQNRSFQILNGDIKTIHHTDCGTTTTTEIFIDTKAKLKQFVGIYHLNGNDEWQVIDTDDVSLLNKPIRMRSLVDCIYPDRHGFCAKCFGDLATSLIDGDKIGQFLSAHVQSKLSQGALSVKHYSSNSHDSVYNLSANAKQFFKKSEVNQTQILIDPSLIKNDGQITISSEEIENINNLDSIEAIKTVSINRYTSVTQVLVSYTDGEWTSSVPVEIESGTKSASLTTDALKYLLDNGWGVDEGGNYVIDLKKWDANKPFIQVPRKKADMVLAGKRFDSFLKGVPSRGKGENDSIVSFTSFGNALMSFQDLTIEHIPMRVSHMQVMMYGLLAADPENNDFRLPVPTNRKDSTFVTRRHKINNGNIAVAMAYERQGSILMNPTSYTNQHRSASDFEYFVMGAEKIERSR